MNRMICLALSVLLTVSGIVNVYAEDEPETVTETQEEEKTVEKSDEESHQNEEVQEADALSDETKKETEETSEESTEPAVPTRTTLAPEPLIKAIKNPAGSWLMSNSRWWYRYTDGGYPRNEWIEVGGEKYHFDNDGYMQTGWIKDNDHWFYLNRSGQLVTDSWIGNYWVGEEGDMAVDSWVDHNKYYVGSDGKWIPDYGVGKWVKGRYGWWYSDGYGGYPTNTLMEIKGTTYYFDANGYMKTGWQLFEGDWYYFNSDGAMQKSRWINSVYYLKEDGKMAVEEWVEDGKYYCGKDGKWIPGYGIGKWVKTSNGWWYDDGMGGCPKDKFEEIGGLTYCFDKSGYMQTGWQERDKKWYYFKPDGAMEKSNWVEDVYYVKEDGSRSTEEYVTIDGEELYFGADGKYIKYYGKPGWMEDAVGRWYSNGDGTYPVNGWAKIDGKWYYFDGSGYLKTGWLKYNNQWYYLTEDGSMQTGWRKIDGYWYYFKEDGSMAAAEYADGYWVGADGRWIDGFNNSLTVASGVSDQNVYMRGIDISKWQGNIDLSYFADGFVIIRVAWSTNADEMAVRNMNLCEQLGIPYGVYVYSYALNDKDAADEADFVLRMIKGRELMCGVWFDMEDADGYKARNGVNPDSPLISSMCKTFCKKIKDAGYHVGIYASYSWFGTYIKGCEDYDVWVAHWGSNDGEMNINLSNMSSIHQYTSRPLDKNVMYVPLEHFTTK